MGGDEQLVALMHASGAIKPLQKSKVQQVDIAKSTSQTSNEQTDVENVIGIWYFS